VFAEGFLGPVFGAVDGVVVGDELDEVDGEFAPTDQLAYEGIVGGLRDLLRLERFLRCEGDGEGANVAEVEIRRHLAGAVGLGMVALLRIIGEAMVDEVPEALEGGVGASGPVVDRLDAAVEVFPAFGDICLDVEAGEVFGALPFVGGFQLRRWDEIFGEVRVEPGPEELERVVVLIEEI
jgi:hypothetical protein